MAFRNTEKKQHGNPQLKASGEVAPTTTCAVGTQACGQFGSCFTSNGDFQGPEVDVSEDWVNLAKTCVKPLVR